MFTKCPECNISFRVTAKVLQQANGNVRCGGCSHAFNALNYLSEEMPSSSQSNDDTNESDELAETSRRLLETLDELAGPEEVLIEDTGVEWRVLDKADPVVEHEEANVTEEMRYDDSTLLPDDFGVESEESYSPPAPSRRASDHELARSVEFDAAQQDLHLSEPEEWTDLLEEVRDPEAEAEAEAEPIEIEEDLSEIADQLSTLEVASDEDFDLADIDSQFGTQAEAMGLELTSEENALTDQFPLLDENAIGDAAVDAVPAIDADEPAEAHPEDDTVLADNADDDKDDDDTLVAAADEEDDDTLVAAADDEDDDTLVGVADDEEAEPEGQFDDESLPEGEEQRSDLESTAEFQSQIDVAARALDSDEEGAKDDEIDSVGAADDEEHESTEALDDDAEQDSAEARDEDAEHDTGAAIDDEDEVEPVDVELAGDAEEDVDAAATEHHVPPPTEEELTVNEEIDQEMMAAAVQDDDFTATLVGLKSPEELFEENAENVETIVMEGEFIRGSIEEEGLAAEQAAKSQLDDPANLADTYAMRHGKVRGGGRRFDPASYGVTGAIIVLTLTLAGQFIHNSRETLATMGLFNQTIAPVYRMLGTPVTPSWDIRGWQFETTSGSVDDAETTLTIVSRLVNRAEQELPYPLVHVSLTDRWEENMGSRILEPGDYLAGDLDPSSPVLPGENFTAVITIENPSAEATGFKLNVCYRVSPGTVRCAIEDFKN